SGPQRTSTDAANPTTSDEPRGTRGVGARDSSTHRPLGQLIGGVPHAAGFGFGGLASRAGAVGAPMAQGAQKRRQGPGEGAHGARVYRASVGDLLPPEGPETSRQALRWCVYRPGGVRDL